LDVVLNLQDDLEEIEKAIQVAKLSLATSTAPKKSKTILKTLQSSHQELINNVEELYASLNIHNTYPNLDGVNLEFVRILLLARDLKINIRKRAIGSFFEWDRLDQAVGGKSQPLGEFIRALSIHFLTNPIRY